MLQKTDYGWNSNFVILCGLDPRCRMAGPDVLLISILANFSDIIPIPLWQPAKVTVLCKMHNFLWNKITETKSNLIVIKFVNKGWVQNIPLDTFPTPPLLHPLYNFGWKQGGRSCANARMAIAEILSPNIRYCAVISRLVAAYTLYMFPCICNFGNKREHIFCRELTNRGPTKFCFRRKPANFCHPGRRIHFLRGINIKVSCSV